MRLKESAEKVNVGELNVRIYSVLKEATDCLGCFCTRDSN